MSANNAKLERRTAEQREVVSVFSSSLSLDSSLTTEIANDNLSYSNYRLYQNESFYPSI